jgi:hypothetical protein
LDGRHRTGAGQCLTCCLQVRESAPTDAQHWSRHNQNREDMSPRTYSRKKNREDAHFPWHGRPPRRRPLPGGGGHLICNHCPGPLRCHFHHRGHIRSFRHDLSNRCQPATPGLFGAAPSGSGPGLFAGATTGTLPAPMRVSFGASSLLAASYQGRAGKIRGPVRNSKMGPFFTRKF